MSLFPIHGGWWLPWSCASLYSYNHRGSEFMSSVVLFRRQGTSPALCPSSGSYICSASSSWMFRLMQMIQQQLSRSWLLTFGTLTSFESLHKLLPAAKRSFQNWEKHKSTGINIYLDGSMTTCPFNKIAMIGANQGPPTSRAQAFDQVYSNRHEFCSVERASNPIREQLIWT